MRAEVSNLVSGGAQFLNHTLVERKACMICANRNSHQLHQRPGVLQNVIDIES